MKHAHRSLLFASVVASSLHAPAAEWKPVVTELLKSEKPGYGGLCGIVVDHSNGDVFINFSDLGLYHSSDQGETWQHATAMPPKGRTESPGCLLIDPTGKSKRMLAALVYGAPAAISDDFGKTFRYLHERSNHIDWCALDWTSDDPQFVLALKHEQKGLMIASNDGGKTFRDVGTGFISGWVFDNETAVVAKEKGESSPEAGLHRTTDGGKTFEACGTHEPAGWGSFRTLPKWRDGKLYWLTKQGLIVTGDRGATWNKVCDVQAGLYGPVFGKDTSHLLLLTEAGIVESTDGGATWADPIAAPPELKGLRGLTWLDYDPKHDTLYLMKMTSDLYRMQRGK